MLLSKASHPTHGTIGPDGTPRMIGPEILGFITGSGSVAGRSAAYANTLGSVLLPDVLVVQTDKDPAPAPAGSPGFRSRRSPTDTAAAS